MAVTLTNLKAMNETTKSVVDTVSCVVLDIGSEFTRQFTSASNPNWIRARIGFKMCFTGDPNGIVNGCAQLFFGICSTNSGWFSNTPHCIGGIFDGSWLTGSGNWARVSSPYAATPYISYNGYGIYPEWKTGSYNPHYPVVGGSGYGPVWVPLNESVYIPSYASSSILGNAWATAVVEIWRNYTSSLGSGTGVRTLYSGGPDVGSLIGQPPLESISINVPKGMSHTSLQSEYILFSGTTNNIASWCNIFSEYDSSTLVMTVGDCGWKTSYAMNETLYGMFNSFTIAWIGGFTTHDPPPVQLAVRDLVVVLI
jgi:hypothetical protein